VGSDNGGQIFWFTDDGGATVSLHNALTFQPSLSGEVFLGGEYNGKTFWGTTSNGKDCGLFIESTDDWSAKYIQAAVSPFSGFQNVSRHNHNGKYFVSLAGAAFGFWFTP
jgi:hypothetical protein